MTTSLPRVHVMAGSDSGGGAGLQADVKTVTALQGFATTAVTALTAQNTLGVQGVVPVEPGFIAEQMRSVLGDIGTDCGKTGMLHNSDVIATVAETWRVEAGTAPLVVDPVMVAQSGDPLLEDDARETLRDQLLPLATVITPNVPEAAVLAGHPIGSEADLIPTAEAILGLGCGAVLLKGGHLQGEHVVDVLVSRDAAPLRFTYPRISTRSNHGTGCTLASAVAAGLAAGLGLPAAVARGRAYLQRALETAPVLGAGAGPVNHGHTVARFDVPED